ncbi:MAG: AAA family ATPase [Woeseiaceae bacterium]
MYERHFGLDKRPFNEKATGTEVFVGPQTAKTMAGFRKALAVQDSVVTVSGPAGTGKTTLVERSLDALGTKYKTVRVGRMRMEASDVLEALLIVLGVKDRPAGTIQRFAALRKKLKELQDAGTRVFVLVEDALRAGADTLAELEVLTVADAGESDGASIVLMGDERLFDFMKDAQLAQLQQRIRQRHRIQPLCVAELRGYLKHCLRVAGGDFDQIFDARSADLLHGLSEGVPRVANNLVDAVLVAAATHGVDKISAKMIATVATDEFGLSVEDFDFSEPTPEPDNLPELTPVAEPQTVAAPKPVVEPAPVAKPEPVVKADPAPTPVLEATPDPDDTPAKHSEPANVIAEAEAPSDEDPQDLPHLIQDTLPDLAILSKRYATLIQDEKDEVADAAEEQSSDPIPELKPEPLVAKKPDPESVFRPPVGPSEEQPVVDIPELIPEPPPTVDPKWELSKEPEFQMVTEVVPQLESGREPDPAPKSEPAADVIPELQVEPLPEPTVDVVTESVSKEQPAPDPVPELEIKLELEPEPEPANNAAPEPAPDSPDGELPEWERDPTLAELKPDLAALEQAMAFTQGEPLAKKPVEEKAESPADKAGGDEIPEITLDKSIETGIDSLDFEEPSDVLPPTPAKEPDPELERIAADIANAKSLEDIDDIMAETLFGTGISMIAAQITANPPDDPANDELELIQETATVPEPAVEAKAKPIVEPPTKPNRSDISEEISIETRPPITNTGIDLNASQRLKTVRALNADLHPSLREPKEKAGAGAAKMPDDAPKPIEDQINTSITQTLKALKVPPELMDEEPEEEPKQGFFSRFRRS